MNICQVLLSRGMGGAENVVKNLSANLAASGHKVTVVISEELQRHFTRIPGLNVLCIGKIDSGDRTRLQGYRWVTLLKTLCLYYKNDFDLLHVHLPQALLLIAAVRKFLQVPIIFTIHGDMGLSIKEDSPWQKDQLIQSLKQVDFFTSACMYFFKLLAECGIDIKERGKVIPNGIDVSLPRSVEPMSLKGDFKIGFWGGDRYLKGGDILIQALPNLVESIPGVMLYVLRETSNKGFIARFARENHLEKYVSFVGEVDFKTYCTYVKSVDMVVLPSRTEGIAMSLLEDMAMGRSIVATDVGGTAELLHHGRNALLVQPHPDDVALAIIRLFEDKKLRDEMERNNLHDVHRFQWNAIADEYVHFYENILQN